MKNLISFPTDDKSKPRKLYRQINVWERIEEGRVAVYRCFEEVIQRDDEAFT
jgi:hypothetical protein